MYATSKPKYLICGQATPVPTMASLHPSAFTTGHVRNGCLLSHPGSHCKSTEQSRADTRWVCSIAQQTLVVINYHVWGLLVTTT